MARPVPLSKLAQDLGINPRKWFGIPKPSPKPGGGISQRKIDNFIDNLAQVRGPAGYLQEISHDKRTVKSVQRLTRELRQEFKPHEIAHELGISTQKWTAIRKRIEEGKAYGPELRESLKQAKGGIAPDHELKESPNGMTYDLYRNIGTMEKIGITWGRDVTPGGFYTLEEAANWWQEIGGGAEYFVICGKVEKSTGHIKYHVYDIRTASELKNKGKLKGIIRAREIMIKEYGNK